MTEQLQDQIDHLVEQLDLLAKELGKRFVVVPAKQSHLVLKDDEGGLDRQYVDRIERMLSDWELEEVEAAKAGLNQVTCDCPDCVGKKKRKK